jgi:hypothetical protein
MSTQKGFRITMGKGFQVKFANGYVVSVQFGFGNYCDNFNIEDLVMEEGGLAETIREQGAKGCDNAEVAVMNPYGEFVVGAGFSGLADDGSGMYCRVTPDQVSQIMTEVQRRV